MSSPRPVIAICAALERVRYGVWDQPAAMTPFGYIRAVQDAGGLALLAPPDEALTENPDELLDRIDGLILAGGADVDPEAYGRDRHPETRHTVPARDRTELALARRAIERDLPVLGICRGMQLINVALGGTLHQHVPELVGHGDHRRTPGSFDDADHDVELQPGSLAARAAGEERHATKSHHHQAVDALGEGLVITGRSSLDDLVEALEVPGCRYVLGIQWHPEADERSPVVGSFVERAREHAAECSAAAI
ncbi:MAG: gamma-glutamyl-gamma-aminobutyrate hydrolase family protein [Solirubrobacteraceae bacterium]